MTWAYFRFIRDLPGTGGGGKSRRKIEGTKVSELLRFVPPRAMFINARREFRTRRECKCTLPLAFQIRECCARDQRGTREFLGKSNDNLALIFRYFAAAWGFFKWRVMGGFVRWDFFVTLFADYGGYEGDERVILFSAIFFSVLVYFFISKVNLFFSIVWYIN